MGTENYEVAEATQDAVLGSLRKMRDGLTWSAARKLMAARRIGINGILCVDEGRRVVPGDVIEFPLDSAAANLASESDAPKPPPAKAASACVSVASPGRPDVS